MDTDAIRQAEYDQREKNRIAQAEYKKRMRKAGLMQVQLWIQPDRKSILIDFANELREREEDMGFFHNATRHKVSWAYPIDDSKLEDILGKNTGTDLEDAVKLVLEAGLSTGHADTCAELVEEVLDQYEELRKKL